MRPTQKVHIPGLGDLSMEEVCSCVSSSSSLELSFYRRDVQLCDLDLLFPSSSFVTEEVCGLSPLSFRFF